MRKLKFPYALRIALSSCFSFMVATAALPGFSVTEFRAVSNIELPSDKSILVDLDSALVLGIRVPTKKQCGEQGVGFTFRLDSSINRKLYYKIFYQNESYKYPLNSIGATSNFYGTWGEVDLGFKEIPMGATFVKDYYRVVGNPRNEPRYFGKPMSSYAITDENIHSEMQAILSTPQWLEDVKAKAQRNKVELEQQLELDAIYSLCTKRDQGTENHRWKRNPRMGRYSAMLVVCTAGDLEKIPAGVKDIGKKEGADYLNPFHYFLSGKGKYLKETVVILDTAAFSLKGSIDLFSGIYIDKSAQQRPHLYSSQNASCNSSDSLFLKAQVEQFFNAEHRNHILKSIPEIKDVQAGEFSYSDYLEAEKKYPVDQLKSGYIKSSSCPCKTVCLDSISNAIAFWNPGSTDLNDAVKENVGIRSRIGFTYGKFTAKVAFPKQLNQYKVWNGVSNSFWLMFQDKQPWNYRSKSITGYTEKGAYAPDAPRFPYSYYSEIDLELIKASRYWPKEVYFGQNGPVEKAGPDDYIVAALTNWDLANQDPPNYAKGFCPVVLNGREFRPFRWEYYYQALTDRVELSHDDIYSGDFFFYQIEWNPESITWRLGPAPDRMKVIGHMDGTVTSIPDNQMLMVLSQEYQLSEWLPPMPFKQEYLPFLKNDLVGKVFELTIE